MPGDYCNFYVLRCAFLTSKKKSLKFQFSDQIRIILLNYF